MTDSTKKTDRTRPVSGTNALTGARAQIFQALTDHPGSSAATLAVAAGLGRSTAGKALATLEGQGIAVREKGDSTPGTATPDLWRPHPDTAPGQVHSLPDQGSAPKPNSASAETADAREAEPEPTSTDSHLNSGESAQAHPATNAKVGAPQTPEPHHEVQPDQGTEPAPLPGRSAHPSDPAPVQADNPPKEHSDATPLDAPAPAPLPGDDAPVQEEGPQPPSEPATSTGTPASVASAPEPSAEIARPEPGKRCPTCGHWRPSDTLTDTGRLRPGALRQIVTAFLASHPDEAFTATAISRQVERSSGAIANSLTAMAKDGIARQVSDSPRRYQYVPPQGGTLNNPGN
ncbi:hypothetical protein [Streptomyces sp. NPDC007083]|uniref:hypothetical protein n=1 Tax=unclassified Streptomyces TaxID=2593676 RepID=UPI0033C3F91E